MMSNGNYIDAYIYYSLFQALITEGNIDGAIHHIILFRERLSEDFLIFDDKFEVFLCEIEEMLYEPEVNLLKIIKKANTVNSWLATGAKLQRIGVSND